MENDYSPNIAFIRDITQETSNTNTYTLEPYDKIMKKKFSYTPGQFIMLSIFGIGEAAISISSDPSNNGFINTTIRNVGNVTNAIFRLKKGDLIGIRGPYGIGWPLDKAENRDILIIAGGMGLAPLRGVINHIKNNRDKYGHLEIIYGARTPGDMIFTYEYDDWKKIMDSTIHLTVDAVPYGIKWDYRIGLVTSCFPGMKTHPRNAIAFVCGPEIMMRYVAKCLENIGFNDDQIYISLERRMKCGIGKCGHCQIGQKYVCKDGPVFQYSDIKKFIRPL
ncbi:MAG: Ni/Fe hydrogenase subunit gamma [Thermoplasmata archaeon]|nr:MAG: Ni/Fe hydrogenase subunit gamma [Thermoplasmata archaeon]RLF29453.1 MAG: Ni/Fe hydrogenase subunit gamma [Thermoplasmata archaeon]